MCWAAPIGSFRRDAFQLITVRISPLQLSTVTLRAERETYETSALPLSYVGATGIVSRPPAGHDQNRPKWEGRWRAHERLSGQTHSAWVGWSACKLPRFSAGRLGRC